MASVELHQIRCAVTRSEDKTEELLDGLGTKECTSGADDDGLRAFMVIISAGFSHSRISEEESI